MTPGAATARPLRIALAVGSLHVGGTETQLVKLATGLRERGHDVHVVAMSQGGVLEEPLRAAGVDVRVFAFQGIPLRGRPSRERARRMADGLRQLYSIWRYLRKLRPDVCHAFLFTCYTLLLPLAWAAGVRVRVGGRRGTTPPPVGVANRVAIALARASCVLMVANSRQGADEAVRRDGFRAERLLVIPNGVELPDRPAAVAHQPARGVMVANLHLYKGHADLVEALALMAEPPSVCLIGDGAERERLTTLIRERGLADVVELAGAREQASRLLAGYQFAVLASHHEGLPNAVLEAMAAGLPVVATAVGGVPELITDDETGLLVAPHSPTELAGALTRLAQDPALRVRLGAAARKAAAAYSVPACVARHESLYLDLVG